VEQLPRRRSRRAQSSNHIPSIGYLGLRPADARTAQVEALKAGLRDLEYIEGKNIFFEFRWASRVEELPELAAELVRMKVDLIFASGAPLVDAARQVTQTIPVVFANHADPVGTGHVKSLGHPGTNITGLSDVLNDLAAKQLEILHKAVPQAKRIGVL
jgi:putative tryptophan/tyrosine transport system substrate-binding protein